MTLLSLSTANGISETLTILTNFLQDLHKLDRFAQHVEDCGTISE